MTGPIRPEDAKPILREIPEEMFEVFNHLIQQNLNGNYAKVMVRDVRKMCRDRGIETEGNLDVEPHYREVGWRVKYDQPGYNESFQAYYEFTRRESNDPTDY